MSNLDETKHVVVVGGAGYLGSVLVRQLLDTGCRVTVFDALLFGEESVRDLKVLPDFTLVQGDLRSISEISAVLQDGVDAVVLLAALVGEKACDQDPRATADINFLGAKLLAEACKYYGIPRFVFASTDSAYGIQEGIMYEDSPLEPISFYARLKMQAEQEILALADNDFGSLWIPGSCSKNAFNEEFQERLAPFSHVVNELKKAQIERKFFLRDPSMGSQPGT